MVWHNAKLEKVRGKSGKETCVWIYDNDKTADRYTIIIGCRNASVYGASEHPFYPTGFGNYVGERRRFPSDLRYLGKRMKFKDMPKDVKKFIRQRIE
jgi:hypothetical protein